MILRILLAILLSSFSLMAYAQRIQFTQLPSEFAPELFFVAPGSGMYQVQVKFRTDSYPSYIKLVSILNTDTLEDYISFKDSTIRLVKSVPLRAQDELTVQVYSNNQGQEDLVGIFGILEGKFTPKLDSNKTSNTYLELPGAVWAFNNPIQLEVNKEKEGKEYLDIKLGLNNSYPYDSLFVKISASGPGNSLMQYQEALAVQKDQRNAQGKIVHLNPKKIKTIAPGVYKIKITHQLTDEHLNGVDFVSWSWVDK